MNVDIYDMLQFRIFPAIICEKKKFRINATLYCHMMEIFSSILNINPPYGFFHYLAQRNVKNINIFTKVIDIRRNINKGVNRT